MFNPFRAAGSWLALSVATLWIVSVGGDGVSQVQNNNLSHLPPTHIAQIMFSLEQNPENQLFCTWSYKGAF